MIYTAQKIASQLTPAPTPTPTPQANFLNLPNLSGLQNILGALPGSQVCSRPGNIIQTCAPRTQNLPVLQPGHLIQKCTILHE